MPVMSHGCPRDSSLSDWNTASGDVQLLNMSPHPHASAISRKMWKSASASPGARATFLSSPSRRSELMNVPSFSPHPAAGRTMCACCAVSVVVYMSCTTSVSRRPRISRASTWLIHECDVLVATTHRPLILPARIPSMIWS